jgi:hypothetical protein
MQCCGSGPGFGSGSGRIRIIFPDQERNRHPEHDDPDPANPDWYKFQAHVGFYFSSESFNMLSKILKIMTPLPLMRKENHCKLALL